MIAATVISCGGSGNDDDGDGNDIGAVSSIQRLTIIIENGSAYASQIDRVELYITDMNHVVKRIPLVSADYNNGNITFDLTAISDPTAFLYVMFGESIMPPPVQVSNRNIKGIYIEVDAYKGDVFVTDFHYGKVIDQDKGLFKWGWPVFISGDVTVSGTSGKQVSEREEGGKTYIEEYCSTYSMNLKAGYNMMYAYYEDYTATVTGKQIKITGKQKHTTTNLGDLKWYRREDFFGN